jgi:hypothetical protein
LIIIIFLLKVDVKKYYGVRDTSVATVFESVSVLFRSVKVTLVFTLVKFGSANEEANCIIPDSVIVNPFGYDDVFIWVPLGANTCITPFIVECTKERSLV